MALNKNDGIKPKNHTIAHIFVMALMIVLMGIFINGLDCASKDYYINTHANYVQEYATIVRYEKVFDDRVGHYSYTTYYEYEADGGVYYGMWQRLIYDEEEAKAQVGKKVPIYVDHALKHHTKTLNFTGSAIWFSGCLSLVCCLTFLNSLIRETIFIVRWTKYKRKLSQEQIV